MFSRLLAAAVETSPPPEMGGNGIYPPFVQHSKLAYVTTFMSDDASEEGLNKLVIHGYNLMATSPGIDRVLIIPKNSTIPFTSVNTLGHFYTSIVHMDPIHQNCSRQPKEQGDWERWFQLNALKLTQYEKLFLLDKNTLILRDPAFVFNVHAPAAPLQFASQQVSIYGPLHNNNALLFEPSDKTFAFAVKLLCHWIEFPTIRGSRKRTPSTAPIGTYTSGLFEELFGEKITSLQKLLFVPADTGYDPRAFIYYFTQEDKPQLNNTLLHAVWKVFEIRAQKFIGLSQEEDLSPPELAEKLVDKASIGLRIPEFRQYVYKSKGRRLNDWGFCTQMFAVAGTSLAFVIRTLIMQSHSSHFQAPFSLAEEDY